MLRKIYDAIRHMPRGFAGAWIFLVHAFSLIFIMDTFLDPIENMVVDNIGYTLSLIVVFPIWMVLIIIYITSTIAIIDRVMED